MKKLIISLAILSLLTASCGKDNNSSNNGSSSSSGGKCSCDNRLVLSQEIYSGTSSSKTIYQYDSQNRIINIRQYYNGVLTSEQKDYEYSNKQVKCKIYSYSNGQVIQQGEYIATYL